MPTLTVTEARAKLYRLIDETASSHEPIMIKGKRGNAVLLSEEDWRAIQETLYLLIYTWNARINSRRFGHSH